MLTLTVSYGTATVFFNAVDVQFLAEKGCSAIRYVCVKIIFSLKMLIMEEFDNGGDNSGVGAFIT
jgi:hypothetical protein